MRDPKPHHTGPVPTRSARAVTIDAAPAVLHGDLIVPQHAHGIVLFAHGSGSGRYSPRNRHVAGALNRRGLATLLMDLLTTEEERVDAVTAHLRFDIALLADRLTAACDLAAADPQLRALPVGLFGASTGAAAALVSAAQRPGSVAAVVSRGGRPDLAADALDRVRAPTLLIVGGNDYPVIDLNEQALARLERVASRMEIIPAATHLFEEPGALDEVARLAAGWFERYLPRFASRSSAKPEPRPRPPAAGE